jgi:hypothetical protein
MNRAELLRSIDLSDARRLLEANLFDPRAYAPQAGLAAGADAFAHFFCEGWKAGLAPNAVFDTRWYLAENPEVAEAGVNPLLHYALSGEPAGLDPSPLFDVRWYRRVHDTRSPLAHYLARRFGPFSPIPEFDADYYLRAYPDVAAARLDPFLHYMRFGYREFRKPAADFNPRLYANRHLAHDRDANPIADLRAKRRAGAGPEARHAPTSFDCAKAFARAGARFEPLAPPSERPPRALALAFYLTQYHRIPENDAWWGEGFTEWTQLARGAPRFAGHYQPRIPGALGFYDLAHVETMREQARLARAAGLCGFVFYLYDFDGRRLLEKPLENFLQTADIDIGFCLMWANENWTRRWDGADEDVLIAQSYDPAGEARRAAEFARHFRDPRYLRLEGRPLLMIYRASLIPDTAATIARWRRLFKEQHREEPLLVMAQCFDDVDPRPLGFDAAFEFPPHKLTKGLPQIYNQLEIFDEAFEADAFAYDALVAASLAESPPDFPLIKTAVPSWDNDARRQGQGLTLVGATPLKYERWLEQLVARARPWRGQPIVCINAWNEWSEGAYLEPDAHFGWAYLNATARALRGAPRARAQLLAIGDPASPLLAAVARQFRAGFGFEVIGLDAGAAVPRGPLAALVARDAAGALENCAEAGLRTLLLLETPDISAVADVIAIAGAAAPDSPWLQGLDALVGAAPEAGAVARALFDRLLPGVAKISAVVVNRGDAGVARRLQSVFAQTHPVVEVLVIDGASTDASFAAIDAAAHAADRDATVALDEACDPGFGAALRRAAEIATGEFVWVVAADGFSDPEGLARLASPLAADASAAFAFCAWRPLDAQGEALREEISPLAPSRPTALHVDQIFPGEDIAARLQREPRLVGAIGATLWRRDALRQAVAATTEGDWRAILRAAAALPLARAAFVAETLEFCSPPQLPT